MSSLCRLASVRSNRKDSRRGFNVSETLLTDPLDDQRLKRSIPWAVAFIGVTLPFLIIGGGAATCRSQDIESNEEGKDSRVLIRVQPMQGTSTDPLVAVFPCTGRRGGVTGVTERGRSGKRKTGVSSCFALLIDL